MRQKSFLLICFPFIFYCKTAYRIFVPPIDLCTVTKAGRDSVNRFSNDSVFYSAKNAIQQAASDKHEHSIVFGKQASEILTTSSITNGDTANGKVNADWLGAFADIHNHTNELPPSAGDLYYLVKLNNKNPAYNTRFIITLKGSVYALHVYDIGLATRFITRYPTEHARGFSPRFPEPIFDDVDRVSIYFEGQNVDRLMAQERALSFVLSKYNTGVVLLKQDSSAEFQILQTEERVSKKKVKYITKVCD